jgi:hypothetical protein
MNESRATGVDVAASQQFGNHPPACPPPLTFRKSFCRKLPGIDEGVFDMNGQAILENVRRYRGIASLYRQTAAFRPRQSWSLLEQAREWEERALAELEAYFAGHADRAVPLAA